MDLICIGLTIGLWSKYGNKVIGITALICSLFEMIRCGYDFIKYNSCVWGTTVGIVCTVLCFIKLFGNSEK